MKNIDTLVEDMYQTITDGTQPSEKDMELFAERVKEGVLQLFNARSENNKLRMSQIGKPDRQVWYQSRDCLLYTSPSPRDRTRSRMPSSA